jgi:hypothetical protein
LSNRKLRSLDHVDNDSSGVPDFKIGGVDEPHVPDPGVSFTQLDVGVPDLQRIQGIDFYALDVGEKKFCIFGSSACGFDGIIVTAGVLNIHHFDIVYLFFHTLLLKVD